MHICLVQRGTDFGHRSTEAVRSHDGRLNTLLRGRGAQKHIISMARAKLAQTYDPRDALVLHDEQMHACMLAQQMGSLCCKQAVSYLRSVMQVIPDLLTLDHSIKNAKNMQPKKVRADFNDCATCFGRQWHQGMPVVTLDMCSQQSGAQQVLCFCTGKVDPAVLARVE